LNGGATGAAQNIIIDNGSSLTVIGNTIQISGSITNNGTFDVTNGIVQMIGSLPQNIGANVFAGNLIKDLKINNPAGVSLLGALNVSGIVKVESGNLASNGNLTLLSTAAQTALIDGSGTGTITGSVTMQRYINPGFGYKYLSSPFSNATTTEFADDITLGSFSFYRYDESRTASGWVGYQAPGNILNPMEGYAVNYGASVSPNTTDITGLVNNGNLSVTLLNHNNLYTKGFNLVGNPYPSPIDWDVAAGWTRTNVDNAIYLFRASTTDQYGGTYSTYVNGISSDGLTNSIIPSMQGFFIHVSDGTYPVTGVLSVNNSARINDLTHPLARSAVNSSVSLIRLSASFANDPAPADPLVIYFNERAATGYDPELDALKLFNTDLSVANLYATIADGLKLSINGLPELTGDLSTIPLGLRINRSGKVVIKLSSLEELPSVKRIYLTDLTAGIEQDLLPDKEYSVTLESGEYLNRFFLNLSRLSTGDNQIPAEDSKFSIYSTDGILKADIGVVSNGQGTLRVYNISGQIMFVGKVYATGYHEFGTNLKNGIYIVNYMSGTFNISKKLFIENR
jgi:fibronectin-binding autotransporter adhesin